MQESHSQPTHAMSVIECDLMLPFLLSYCQNLTAPQICCQTNTVLPFLIPAHALIPPIYFTRALIEGHWPCSSFKVSTSLTSAILQVPEDNSCGFSFTLGFIVLPVLVSYNKKKIYQLQ